MRYNLISMGKLFCMDDFELNFVKLFSLVITFILNSKEKSTTL